MSTATNATAATPRVARRRSPKPDALPTFGVADGAQSWRYELRARERAVVDRALAILGSKLRTPKEVIDSPQTVSNYLRLHLAADPCERFSALYLDSQNRVIAYECHFAGTLTQAIIYPREIVAAALKHRAHSVIFSHNHPSGNPTPSLSDVALSGAAA